MSYIICYIDMNSNTVWESIYGEDAMQVRVSELMDKFECDSGEIMVFDIDSQL